MAGRIVLMRGLPGSGKTTKALAMIRKEPGRYVRVNRDTIREMNGITEFDRKSEKSVAHIRDSLILEGLRQGKDIIIDDTNLDLEKKITHFRSLTEEQAEFEVIDMTDVPLYECIERDAKRGTKAVGRDVVWHMYEQYLKPEAREFSSYKKPAIICDIDGTLAIHNGRSPYDETKVLTDKVNSSLACLLNVYNNSVYIILVSGRHESCRSDTELWLDRNHIKYDELYMRPANDNRPDFVIKREIFDKHIESRFNVELVLDDRDQVVWLWRSLGLTCLQVGYGPF